MTSKDRHQARYLRRKRLRDEKTNEFLKSLGSFDDVFTYDNLYESFKFCKRGVMWKDSIQRFQSNLPTNIANEYEKLHSRAWKTKGFTTFTIMERGKLRKIQSVTIGERCVQRTFCDHYLVPALSRGLIYDNGASMKGKGIDFAIRRLEKQLKDYYKKYKTNVGYALVFDFSNYFGNISHEKLFKMTDKFFIDEDLRKLYHHLIDAFDNGLGLGSQVCQISAIKFADKIDHLFKDKLGVKGYSRYMDDGVIIANTIQEINKYKAILKSECNKLGIILNKKKVNVCRIDKGIQFLKKKYRLLDNGRVVIRLLPKSLTQARRKYKRLLNKLKNNEITYDDILQAYKSWRGNAGKYQNYLSLKNIDNWFNKNVLYYDGFPHAIFI